MKYRDSELEKQILGYMVLNPEYVPLLDIRVFGEEYNGLIQFLKKDLIPTEETLSNFNCASVYFDVSEVGYTLTLPQVENGLNRLYELKNKFLLEQYYLRKINSLETGLEIVKPDLFEFEESRDEIEDLKTFIDPTKKTYFRFKEINEYIQGFNRKQIFCVASSSNVGKSIFCMQLAESIAQSVNEKYMYFDLENSKEAHRLQRISMEFYKQMPQATFIDWINCQNKHWNDDNFLKHGFSDYEILNDKPQCSLEYIEAQVKKSKEKIGLIVIDHFYILQKNGKDEYSSLTDNANSLMKLAKRTDCRVLVVAQTRKPTDKTGKGQEYEEVKSEDLRGAKSLMDASDYLLGLWRDSESESLINWKILKNRRGPVGRVGQLTKNGTYYQDT